MNYDWRSRFETNKLDWIALPTALTAVGTHDTNSFEIGYNFVGFKNEEQAKEAK